VGIVLLQLDGQFVAQVPLLNLQTFASWLVDDLIEVSETDTHRWKLYTYSVSTSLSKESVEQWASWIALRAIPMNDDRQLHVAFHAARAVEDVNYQDALLDAMFSHLQEDQPPGKLDVDRLCFNEFSICWDFPESHQCMLNVFGDLMCDLVLHHDAEACPRWSTIDEEEDEKHYDPGIREAIPEMALAYFTGPEREPKDPLQLSDEGFCEKYHAHNKEGLPCYKTQRLPGNA
jgi:hypothetical protein